MQMDSGAMVPEGSATALCRSADLGEGASLGFDVCYSGLTCTAFAVRFRGQPYAYLNRCTHVAMEMDGRAGQVFDETGRWLLCHVHGAAYEPATGSCAGGPCRGGLVKIQVSERDGWVRWHTAYNLKPAEF